MVHPDPDIFGILPYLAPLIPWLLPYAWVVSLTFYVERWWFGRRKTRRVWEAIEGLRIESARLSKENRKLRHLLDLLLIKITPMELFRQTDPRWAGKPLGASSLHMGPEGCLTTCHADALQIAGYPITPADFCTDPNLYTKDGLFLWYAFQSRFPQYRLHTDASARFKFVQVIATFGDRRFQHWNLLVDGTYYDPLDGTSGPTLKPNYNPTGRIWSADIEPSGKRTFDPFTENLSPSQEVRDEVKRVQDYLIALGLMTEPAPENKGKYGPKTQAAIHAFQGDNGILNTSRYGWWYDKTREAANKNLTV